MTPSRSTRAPSTPPITINLQVGWGEIDGKALAPGALGETIWTQTGPYTYSQIQAALTSSALAAGNTTLARRPLPARIRQMAARLS